MKIAVIGAGYWGKNIIKTCHQLGVLKAFSEENLETANSIQTTTQAPCKSIDEIIDDNEIDGVMIATPVESHYEIASKCLNAKKNIFIEKPVCLNLTEAKNLKKLAQANSLIIMIGHLLNYHSHFMRMIELSKNSDFGKLIRVKSYRKSFGKVRDNENVIWSFATHDISMINRLTLGNVSGFKFIKRSYFNDNCDSAYISYSKNDVSIEIDVDWSSIEKLHRIELYFQDGIIVFDDTEEDIRKKLFIVKTNFSKKTLMNKVAFNRVYIPVDFTPPLENECLHFIECIENKRQPITDINEAIEVLKLLIKTNE